jgi:hypothetical protein
MFGADAKQLAPKELLDQAYELLLSAAGVPMELFKGSLQFQVVPAALRLFESMWTHIPQALNCFLAFLARRLSRCLAWEKVKIRLTRVTMIDDLQKAQERLQLGVGGAISQTDALKAVGLDYREQLRKQMEEAKFKAELDAKMQEEMQGKDMARQMALGGPPGGAPGQQSIVQGQGQSVGQDPSAAQQGGFSQAGMIESMMGGLGASGSYRLPDMVGVAGQLATQLLSMPESARQSQLIQLRNRNEAVWALVRAQIDKITNRMRTQGKNQLMAQQFGGT